jgi:hypothetical protein
MAKVSYFLLNVSFQKLLDFLLLCSIYVTCTIWCTAILHCSLQRNISIWGEALTRNETYLVIFNTVSNVEGN